ncbi:MAG: hypothetical protein JSV65_12415, partial [Armatimonadota bacterium]
MAPVDAEYALAQLEALVAIESPAPAESPLVDYVERELNALGMATQRVPLEHGRDNLLASVGGGSPIVCLNTHADTVPRSGESQAQPRRDGDRLWGLG